MATNPTPDSEQESLRLAMELEQQEMANYQPTQLSADMLEGLDDETRQSIELAMRLEEEERSRLREQVAAAERLQGEPEDEESLALAMRLQQEDDETALSNALGIEDRAGSPSQYSYEQLMRLQDAVGMVSRGANAEDISALRTLTVAQARQDGKIVLGEQCSICRMEFEDADELRCLPCNHAEHAECLDQWLAINKSCPICQTEVSGHDKPCDACDTSAPMLASPSEARTPTAAPSAEQPASVASSAALVDSTNAPEASTSAMSCSPVAA